MRNGTCATIFVMGAHPDDAEIVVAGGRNIFFL